ncbi:MAG TPA: class I SAM-dependent methyltransferase [Oligoflexia bacterium]|nr:class I SAM-dependent methyltransferase [Oligoflexia bacterium]
MSTYKEFGYTSEDAKPAHAYLIPSLLKLLNPATNKKIIDLGCGNGYVVRQLIKLGFDAYGTDASEEGIAIAKSFFSDRFFLQDLTKDTLPGGIQHIKFDTIISTEVIEHLYSPADFIAFCKNVLKESGGQIIISTPYHGYLKNLALAITNSFDKHWHPLREGGHIKFWSRHTLSALLEEHGFEVISFLGSGRLPFLWKSMLIKAQLKV